MNVNSAPPSSVWRYFAVTLVWTWSFWIPASVVIYRTGDVEALTRLPWWSQLGLFAALQLGAYGPSIVAAAVVVTYGPRTLGAAYGARP